jgi:dephospho-CoA kinase
MVVLGLTGGVACGKSTVAAGLRARGVAVVDADEEARRLVDPGSAVLDALVGRFGEEILREDGSLDRKRLGSMVFGDADALAALNALTRGPLLERINLKIKWLCDHGHPLALVDAALLVEWGLDADLDGLIVVATDRSKQIERQVARDGLSAEQAAARVDAQLPLADKIARATIVLRNDSDLEALRSSIADLYGRLCALYPELGESQP